MRLLLPAALALSAALTGCAGDPEAARDEAGAVASAGSLDAFSIKLGDCLDQPVSASGKLEEVLDVKAVPCSAPHDGEVFARDEMPDGPFPGDAAVSETVDETCVAQFATFVGLPLEESKLAYSSLQPIRDSWVLKDDREILCIVQDPDARTTGSLKGAKR